MQHGRVIVDPSGEIQFSFHFLPASTLAHFFKFGRLDGPGILTLHKRKVLMGRIIRLMEWFHLVRHPRHGHRNLSRVTQGFSRCGTRRRARSDAPYPVLRRRARSDAPYPVLRP